VQQGLAAASRAHRQWQEIEAHHGLWKFGQHSLVTANPGVVVGITRLIEPDNRMDEDVGAGVPRRLHHHCLLSSMDGAVGLEGEHLPPPETREQPTKVRGSLTQFGVIKMDGQLEGLDSTGHRPPPGAVKILCDAVV